MSSKTDSQYVHLKIPGLEISLSWPHSTAGDKLYLKINTVESIIANLNKAIRIARIGETNLAKLTVESESPQMAQMLANIIIEKYRTVRLENKRQNVMYSFQFVNDQLEDVKQKLEIAESELSAFKSENQIAIMDESSRDIIQFLAEQTLTVNAVAEKFDVSRPAISKHLKILEECGIVVINKQGRERFCQIQPKNLIPAFLWIDQYRNLWEDKLDAFENYLTELQAKNKKDE